MCARADAGLAEGLSTPALLEALLAEARAVHAEDADACRRMGELGAALLPREGTVLTHCNAGALATGGMGTALAPDLRRRRRRQAPARPGGRDPPPAAGPAEPPGSWTEPGWT